MGIESLRRVHGLAAGDWKVDEAEGEGHKPSVATALNVEEVAWGILCARWGAVDLAPSPILHGAPQSPTIGLGAKARGGACRGSSDRHVVQSRPLLWLHTSHRPQTKVNHRPALQREPYQSEPGEARSTKLDGAVTPRESVHPIPAVPPLRWQCEIEGGLG